MLAAYGRPAENQVAADALSLIVSILGDKALPDLVAAVDSPAPALRGAALEAAVTLEGDEATARWVEKGAASGPEVRAAIVAMLGRRGDATALPFVRQCLREPRRGRPPGRHTRGGPPRRQSGRTGPRRAHRRGR
ncbi:MAG: hypothetical protein MZW92_61140 [Comamonadaceae bacterium]|nr:hypothetical protein [Comamonadaceae bacterium]